FSFSASSPSTLSTLSLHDALPISGGQRDRPERVVRGDRRVIRLGHAGDQPHLGDPAGVAQVGLEHHGGLLFEYLAEAPLGEHPLDRKSTRLNSSHVAISYAVFCLK